MLSFFIVLIVIIMAMFWYTDKTKTKYNILETKYNELKKKYDELLKYTKEHPEVKAELLQKSTYLNAEPKVEAVPNTVHAEEPKTEVTVEKPVEPEVKKVEVQKQKMDFNIKILFAGAFLIILSGIVLLSSGWDVLPGAVKSLILFAFMGVFIKLSNTLRKKNVTNAANIFFYISMAYLPLCLLSISLFGLLGEYLSFAGEGRFIYLTAVFLATSYVYYRYYKKNGTDGLFYASILSQLFTVVLGTMIFEVNVTLALLSVSIYNFLLALLLLKKSNNIRIVSTIISTTILASILVYIFGADNVVYNIYTILVFLVNSLTLFLLNKDVENYVLATLYNISNIVVVYVFTKHYALNVSSDTRVIVMMLFALISAITKSIGLTNKKAISETNVYVVEALFAVMLVFRASLSMLFGVVDILYLALGIVFSIYGLIKYKRTVQVVVYIVFATLFGWALQVRLGEENAVGVLALVGLLQLVVIKNAVRFIPDKSQMKELSDFELLSNLLLMMFLVIDTCNAVEFGPSALLLIVGFVIIYLYYLLSKKDSPFVKLYRVFFIGSLGIVSSLIHLILNAAEYYAYLNSLLVIDAVLFLQILFDERYKDKFQHILISIITIVLGFVLVQYARSVGNTLLVLYYLAYIGLSASSFMINRTGKLSFGYDIPLQIALAMVISEIYMPYHENAVHFISYLVLLAFTFMLGKEENKFGFNVVFAYIIGANMGTIFDDSQLATSCLFIGISAFYYYIIDGKAREWFKLIGLTSVLYLYIHLVRDKFDINLNSLIAIPVYLYAFYILNIFTNRFKNNKALKIIVYAIIFFEVLGTLSGGLDELILLLFLLGGVIYSYNQRLEGEFLASLSLIVISAFMLVSEIFVAIPWWVYLVVVGGLLLSYGVKNESKESNGLVDRVRERFKDNNE